jgi:hypothetical protein
MIVLSLFKNDPNPQRAIDYRRKTFTFPLFLNADRVFRKYRVDSLPCNFLIGRDGKIAARYRDLFPTDEQPLEERVKELLVTPAPSP